MNIAICFHHHPLPRYMDHCMGGGFQVYTEPEYERQTVSKCASIILEPIISESYYTQEIKYIDTISG